MVVDYYHAPFNIIRDTSGLERNVWNLSYTYVARDLSEYSLKDFVRNGTISPPDSTTFAKGDFSYIYQLPMCVGNDFKFKTRVRVKPGFGADSLQLIMNFFTNNWNSAIVQFTGNTNFDGFQVNYIQNVNDTIRQQDFSQTGMHQVNFPDWRTVTIWFKDNLIKVYVDDTLRGSKFLTGDYSGLKGFSFGGWNNTPLEFDYVKIYDRNNVAQFIEEFDDYRYFAKVPYAFICPAVNCQSAFTNFFNSHASTQLTYNQIIQEFKEKCGIQFESCGIGSGPTLCGSVDPIFSPAEPHQPTACDDSTMISTGIGTQLYNAYIDSLKNVFEEKYLSRCLNARFSETFTVSAPISEFHYTLYYYDQAGNLVKTIPPAGVNTSKFAHARAWSDSVISARDGGTVLIPTHGLQTQYRYNTLNQVVQQTTPDAGLSNFWYDRLGRLAVSQNADQKLSAELNSLYSYTRYDHLGRISQVGQIRNNNGTEPITHLLVRNQAQLESWLSARNLLRGQITETYYDAPYIGFSGQESNTIWQRNLRNRVSFTSLTDSASMSAFNQATFYSYDIHGNVDTLLQDYGPLTGVRNIMNIQVQNSNRWKRMVYQYDLISGKVNHFAYQPPRGSTYYPDMFYHRYFYDAENRLTLAETSTDSIHWEKDMRYEYYHHGPLARTVTGEQQVQGTDYIYTLQGWIKGVNGINIADSTRDAGLDGNLINGNPSKWVARDAYGYNLNYFAGDYIPINANVNPFPGVSAHLGSAHRPLYNGNIGSMAVSLKFPNPTAEQVPQLYNYSYDQLNRLTGMDVYRGFNATAHSWSAMTTTTDFRERISYDGNGNILRYLRNGISSISTTMDSLRYSYYTGTNRLKFVRDAVGDNVYTQTANDVEDIDNQSNINLVTNPDTSNYKYTNIGNLRADVKDSIKVIRWNVYGKIIEIERIASSVRPVTNIKYTYDASGNRISKRVARSTNNIADYTWYVRDAQGNVIATYVGSGAASTTLFSSNYNLVLTEQHMYGSSRIGVLNRSQDVKTLYSRPSVLNIFREQKNYELTNHLGNVLATLSDKKIGIDANSDGTIEYYVADVITANDYYPGGMMMPRREYQQGNQDYRFSINGQEKEKELNKNITTALYWEYDSRIVRRWNIDPKPSIDKSLYAVFANNPNVFSDPYGDTTEIRNSKGVYINTLNDKGSLQIFVVNSKYDKFFEPLKGVDFSKMNKSFLKRFKSVFSTAGITYDINSIRKFYNNWSKAFPAKKIDGIPITKNNVKVNGKAYLKPLYAESVLYLTVENFKVIIPNTKPESTGDLLKNSAETKMKIHPHPALGKMLSLTIDGQPYNIASEDGPSDADYERVQYREGDEERDIVVDNDKIVIYNQKKEENITINR